MRVVLLLLVLAVTGIALVRWLNKLPASAPPQSAPNGAAMPMAPARPQDIKAFEQDINRFMQDAAKRRTRQEPQQ
ncbi:MAG TPA: hypothetical protein PKY50_14585 [Candidatus Competibacter sp.]|nr:hypothetical protein [Candidatus Competibacter sp.]